MNSANQTKDKKIESIKSELTKSKTHLSELKESHKKAIANYEVRLTQLKTSIDSTNGQ